MMAGLLSGLLALDARAFLLINRSLQNPLFDLLMPILSAKRYFLLPAAALMVMLLTWGGRRMWVVLAAGVLALALADQGTNLIKAGVHRTRPCHVIAEVHLLTGCTRSFSFPSNHASNMFALATVGWLGFRRWRWALLVLAAGVAYSRVYLGVHYPGDVLAGALWGAAVGWGCTGLAARIWPGSFDPRTTTPRPTRGPAGSTG
jgi:undecaprenyl-diphosphatase